MRAHLTFLASLGVVLCSFSQLDAAEPPLTVHGRLIVNGQPAPNVTVWLQSSALPTSWASDEFGKAKTDVRGEYEIEVPTNWVRNGLNDVWFLSGEVLANDRLSIKDHVTQQNRFETKIGYGKLKQTLRVLSPNGEPVVDAKVRPTSAYVSRFLRQIPVEASKALERSTDKNGRVRFAYSTAGNTRYFDVEDTRFGLQTVGYKNYAEDDEVDLKLRPVGTVSGVVVDRDGKPANDVAIKLTTLPPSASQTVGTAHVRSDERGRFSTTIAVGDLFINPDQQAENRFYLPGSEQRYSVKQGENTSLKLTYDKRMIKVDGSLVNKKTKKAVSGATLRANYGPPFESFMFRTDAKGAFELQLPPGSATIEFVYLPKGTNATYVGDSKTITLELMVDQPQIKLPIELTPQVTLRGKLIDKNGNAPPRSSVSGLHNGRRYGHTLTDPQGGFELKLPAGIEFRNFDVWFGQTSHALKLKVKQREPLILQTTKH